MKILRLVKAELIPVNEKISRLIPDLVCNAPQRVDVALLHGISCAINCPDPDVAIGFALGFQPVGDMSSSGWWEPEISYASRDLVRENHDGWICHVERSLRAHAPGSSENSSLLADMLELSSKTLEEVGRRALQQALFHGRFWMPAMASANGAPSFDLVFVKKVRFDRAIRVQVQARKTTPRLSYLRLSSFG